MTWFRRRKQAQQASICLPVLQHPTDYKVMHDPTMQKCSSESADICVEPIKSLNKSERGIHYETQSTSSRRPRLHVCLSSHLRHWEMPRFGVHDGENTLMQRLSPSFNFGYLGIKCTPARLLVENISGRYIAAWLFKIKGKRAGKHTYTHARQQHIIIATTPRSLWIREDMVPISSSLVHHYAQGSHWKTADSGQQRQK